MIRRKICMLGAFAAGKTSLVQRFARGLFSERYRTTVGVQIEKTTLQVEGRQVDLILWDLYGEDGFQRLRESYLRGAAGVGYVVDGTRAETVDVALDLRERVEVALPRTPGIAFLNKTDLVVGWEVDARDRGRLEAALPVHEVSARTGEGVEDAFRALARMSVGA